jgi:hypothetical protein
MILKTKGKSTLRVVPWPAEFEYKYPMNNPVIISLHGALTNATRDIDVQTFKTPSSAQYRFPRFLQRRTNLLRHQYELLLNVHASWGFCKWGFAMQQNLYLDRSADPNAHLGTGRLVIRLMVPRA